MSGSAENAAGERAGTDTASTVFAVTSDASATSTSAFLPPAESEGGALSGLEERGGTSLEVHARNAEYVKPGP